VTTNLPAYHAVVTFPPGLDETRLHIEDEHGEHVVSTTWRPSSNFHPGPADWDYRLHQLGYARVSPWTPDADGIGCHVQRITRTE
jgi:hypothetical protein